MSNEFSTLFGKATQDLEACTMLLVKPEQHDNSGGHLCKSAEKYFKSYLELCGITNYPKDGKNGHDLSLLLKMLKETDFPVDSYVSLLKLQIYDSAAGYGFVPEERRISLKPVIKLVEDLKVTVMRKYQSTRTNGPK